MNDPTNTEPDRRADWAGHERLLDALHAALEQAERLNPLDDRRGLAAILAPLARAGWEIAGLLTATEPTLSSGPPPPRSVGAPLFSTDSECQANDEL